MTRILHTPCDVAGHASGLSRAERALGLESEVVVTDPGPFGYRYDRNLNAGNDTPLPLRMARRGRFLAGAVGSYDVFHFHFGQTLFPVRRFGLFLDELPLLRRRNKIILATFHGCDVRRQFACPCTKEGCARTDRDRPQTASRMIEYADRVMYTTPDLKRWLPGARLSPQASIDTETFEPVIAPERDELVIVHAPTNREYKGTAHVIAAVDELLRRGRRVRLDLVEGVSQEEVHRRVADADIVVDQVKISVYGVFAVEAMAMAKPVLCYLGDYEEFRRYGDDLPIVNTTPETLADDLEPLLDDRALRLELGARGRRFAGYFHDPVRIARANLDGLVPLPAELSVPTAGHV